MLKSRCAIVVVILSALFAAGCGGEESKPVDLKGTTDTAKFKGMLEQQVKTMPGGNKAVIPTPK